MPWQVEVSTLAFDGVRFVDLDLLTPCCAAHCVRTVSQTTCSDCSAMYEVEVITVRVTNLAKKTQYELEARETVAEWAIDLGHDDVLSSVLSTERLIQHGMAQAESDRVTKSRIALTV